MDGTALTGIEAAIEAFAAGALVVVTDDDGRENEGDLIVAAVHCTPEKMAFMVRHTSGIVCAPLTAERARALNLGPMVSENDAPHATAFTVSVDYRHGTTTGISAEERTLTARNLANPNVGAADFVRPGHVFPLVSREGGVLIRSGHTEAATDLCRLAGLPEVGVICELVNDDGTVMRGPQIAGFVRRHGLLQISVADLTRHRQRTETLVTALDAVPVETEAGPAVAHAFAAQSDPTHHLAIVYGDPTRLDPVPVRFMVEDVVENAFGARSGIRRAGRRFGETGGVIVYLREGSVGVGASLPRPAGDTGGHAEDLQRQKEWREIGLGAQILRAMGISRIHLLASRARHYVGLEAFGVEIMSSEVIGSGDG